MKYIFKYVFKFTLNKKIHLKKKVKNKTGKIEKEEENPNLRKFSELIDYLKEAEYFCDLDVRSLHFDPNNIQISVLRNELLIISHQKIYLMSLENQKANKKVFQYTLKNTCLIGILEHSQLINNIYLLSNKDLFKIRINSDFRSFENFLLKINEGKFSKINKDELEFDFKFISELEKSLSNFIANLNDFFKTKVESFECAQCLRPGKVKCSRCSMEHYCCESHLNNERLRNHFFECYVIQFIRGVNELDNVGVLRKISGMKDFSKEIKSTRITILGKSF